MVMNILRYKNDEKLNLDSINIKLEKLNEEISALRIMIDNPESIIKCITNAFIQFNILYSEVKKEIEMAKTNLILIQEDIQELFSMLKKKTIEEIN